MRLVFMGSPDFAVPALQALMDAGHRIAAVYTRPARPGGRGQHPRPCPVAARAGAMGLEVRSPDTLRGAAARDFAALGADVAIVAAYGLILPGAVLEAPPRGCLNIHASLLPRWRGAAPIQRAIMAGDAETGISIMAMEPGLDTGPVLLTRRTKIGETETAGELSDRLAAIGAEAIVETLDRLDDLKPEPQPESGATYAAKIDKAEARIDWSRPGGEIARKINALSPFPGAWCELAGERVKLLRARVAGGAGRPGTVLGGFTVAAGDGAVEVLEAQRPGRRPQPAGEFLRGLALPARLGAD